ncbi:hypothetical protein HY256_03570 [Candidatus Sumerlaeota bacterium]|nr:hypothetical protein [Candidatus Sumerlaeota bacterium]
MGIHTGLFVLAYGCGYRMRIPYDYIQLLSPDWLRDHFFRSIFYLHSQPPLLNFFLGIGLKIAAWTQLSPETVLLAFHFLLGLGVAASFAVFTSVFIRNRALSNICFGVLLGHPVIFLTEHHYFYTFQELAYLAPLACCAWFIAHRPRARSYAVSCALVVALVYTRSLFHFLFGMIAIGFLGWLIFRNPQAGRTTKQKTAGCFVLSSIALILWPLKNLLVFGVFTYSSWQGGNMAQGLDLDPMPPVERTVPAKFAAIPALASEKKADGSINYNHISVVLEARIMQELGWRSIRRDPSQIARRIARNYWSMTRFTGRQPHFAIFGVYERLSPPLEAWMKLYEIALCVDFRDAYSLRDPAYKEMIANRWLPSAFFLMFPVVLILSALKIVRLRKSNPDDALTAAFLLGCILLVTAMILLVDGREGNRMRFSTEPYLICLVFWLIPGRQNTMTPRLH